MSSSLVQEVAPLGSAITVVNVATAEFTFRAVASTEKLVFNKPVKRSA